MGKKIRSARGELVDFDLLKIKEQMASAPAPVDVRQRQNFIEQRLRRRLKKTPTVPVKTDDKDVKVDPKMPATEELGEEQKMIENPVNTQETPVVETKEVEKSAAPKNPTSKKKSSSKKKQRARPLTPENNE